MYVCMYVFMYVFMYMYGPYMYVSRTHTHTHTHTYTHTHTHTHTTHPPTHPHTTTVLEKKCALIEDIRVLGRQLRSLLVKVVRVLELCCCFRLSCSLILGLV